MPMELVEAIRGRRSIRRYKDTPVPLKLVKEVLEAATWAPSAKNGQQWRFIVLTGGAKSRLTDLFRVELGDFIAKHGKEASGSSTWSCGVMEEAPVLVMVYNTAERGWDSEVHSVAAATQNMLLRAHDLGLGSLWIADIYYALKALEEHLGKPWKLMAAVTLGYPAEEGRVPKKMRLDEVSEFLE
jgi:nitroreductase